MIKKTAFVLMFFAFFALDRVYPKPDFNPLNLMPVPQKVGLEKGKFLLADSFTIAIKGAGTAKLYPYASRVLNRLRGRTGLYFSQAYITAETNPDSATMVIRINRPGKVRLGEDESYRLHISPGKITLTAETDIGAMRGLETFLQLLTSDRNGYYFPALKIVDYPRFPWRGLLIDVCRHFMPVEVIKRNLDGMAALKLNVFHWHLSEDQGFRVESKTFPKLQQLGSDGFYYTQDQIRDIIRYAAQRGIRVVPEFDLPGHATSWLVGYPRYASAPGPYTLEREWGVFDATFDPTREETYRFLDAFIKEMAHLFPDPYMHIGGDENNGKQWDANTHIQQFMKDHHLTDNHALQAYFNNRLLKILTKYHKRMVGWDEILHPDMPTNIVIQSWRGRDSMIRAAREGYQTILSNGYYIDLIQPTAYHYLNDPAPADLPLTEAQRKMILGGEATMWSEMVSPETIDSRIWPRTAAIAERFWSPAHIRDVDDMYRRLEVISFHLEELGLTHLKNYPMMLRRLCNNQDIGPLRNLVDIIEPVKFYQRNHLRKQYSYTPLTRVVDAARPDAELARRFRREVDTFLKNGGYADDIRSWLELWIQNDLLLQPIIDRSPVLWEIRSLSRNLSLVAETGLQALNSIRSKRGLTEEEFQKAQKIIQTAKEPQAQTELMIVPAIEKLVEQASPKK